MEEKTPKALGYHMPAEWETHEGTWLIWPHNDTHEGSQLHLEHLWLEMTRALHEYETVHIIVPDERRREHLHHQLSYYGLSDSNLDVHMISNDDVWVRDCGPIFLVNNQGELAISTWNFNGWGERYPFKKDRLIPVPKAALMEIENYLAVRQCICPDDPNPYLLAGKKQKALRDYQVRFAFHRAVKDIGLNQPRRVIGNINFSAPTPHSLRHSFAVNTLKAIKERGKCPRNALPVLATYMGHSEYKYTSVYLRVTDALSRNQLVEFALWQKRKE